MPGNRISPPPYHIKDVNSEEWRRWFSLLKDSIDGIDADAASGDTVVVEDNQFSFTAQAGENLAAYVPVYLNSSNQVKAAYSSDLTTRNVVGLTATSALAGQDVEVITDGVVENPSWVWQKGDPLFIGEGMLTQTPPTTGYVLLFGFATDTGEMTIHKEPSIELFTSSVVPPSCAYFGGLFSPLGAYCLEESGENLSAADDASSNGADGSYAGSAPLGGYATNVSWLTSSMRTVATSDRVQITPAALVPASVKSMAMWFTIRAHGTSRQLAGRGNSGSGFWTLAFASDGRLIVGGSGFSNIFEDDTFTSGTHLLILQFESNVMKLYVDDVLIGSSTSSGLNLFASRGGSRNWWIGNNELSPASPANMNIGPVSYYSTALDSDQRTELYTLGLA